MRTPIIAANWKMNLRHADAIAYCRRMRDGHISDGIEVVIFPPFPLLRTVAEGLPPTAVAWGGQDIHPEEAGAHTGDTAGAHLLDWGATWALCGHSERRGDHAESDELVGEKVSAAARCGLAPMLCVGETESEREAGHTEEVLARQLRAGLGDIGASQRAWALAYEPVWAIGTGSTATPALAQEAHRHLRSEVAEVAGSDAADRLRILYGGSVKPDNCEQLLDQGDIDGFLIGGASLDPGSFLDIIRRCGSLIGTTGGNSA